MFSTQLRKDGRMRSAYRDVKSGPKSTSRSERSTNSDSSKKTSSGASRGCASHRPRISSAIRRNAGSRSFTYASLWKSCPTRACSLSSTSEGIRAEIGSAFSRSCSTCSRDASISKRTARLAALPIITYIGGNTGHRFSTIASPCVRRRSSMNLWNECSFRERQAVRSKLRKESSRIAGDPPVASASSSALPTPGGSASAPPPPRNHRGPSSADMRCRGEPSSLRPTCPAATPGETRGGIQPSVDTHHTTSGIEPSRPCAPTCPRPTSLSLASPRCPCVSSVQLAAR
mmetsp:Transcript_25172/g.43021  ORF Transcript_25172/g.43021 Transcript_25172/m.43021 type:complete len:287 (+) Transcript_25172:1089-1949(+)